MIKFVVDFYRPKLFPRLKIVDSNFMKLISRYRSEKPWYDAIFSPTETHTFQTRLYDLWEKEHITKRGASH